MFPGLIIIGYLIGIVFTAAYASEIQKRKRKRLMKFSLKIEDLVAFALIVFASAFIFVGLTYKAKATTSRKPTSERLLDLPMIKPTKIPASQGRSREAQAAQGQLFKIGIIDTGYDKSIDEAHVNICPTGSFDFMTGRPVVAHTHFHGTAVAQTIASELEDVNYCFVIFQVGTPLGITSEALGEALKKAAQEGLIAVNISLEGNMYSFTERAQIQKLTSKGTAVFVAAGNRDKNLDLGCVSYPGCYQLPNMYVVGATEPSGEFVASYSNYGSKVQVWKVGTIEFNGQILQGTSFASPRALGDYVHSLSQVAAGQ